MNHRKLMIGFSVVLSALILLTGQGCARNGASDSAGCPIEGPSAQRTVLTSLGGNLSDEEEETSEDSELVSLETDTEITPTEELFNEEGGEELESLPEETELSETPSLEKEPEVERVQLSNTRSLTSFSGDQCARKLRGSTIYYSVSRGFSSTANYMEGLKISIAEFQTKTPIRFVRGRGTPSMTFKTSSLDGGVASCRRNSATISIGQLSGVSPRGVANYLSHEVLHGLGFAHEQQRADRDKYLAIIDQSGYWANEFNNRIKGRAICDGGFKAESLMYNYGFLFKFRSNFKPLGISNRAPDTSLAYSDIMGLHRSYGGRANATCVPPVFPKVTLTQNLNESKTKRSVTMHIQFQGTRNLKGYRVVLARNTPIKNCKGGILVTKTMKIERTNLNPKGRYRVGVCSIDKNLGESKWLSKPLVVQ